MDLSSDQSIRLDPQDEYNHPIESAQNFNESMYLNLFDHNQKMGGWFRIGNRPNEGYAEMSCCVYLPDGRIGFMYLKPSIDNNDAFDAGGMQIKVIEPFKELRVTYDGKVCLLTNPDEMADPRAAFKNNPNVPCKVDLTFFGASPIFGGEKVNKDGSKFEEKEDESFARAHYEQHMSGNGQISVGDETWTIEGLGLRDHSWGPRYWQNLYWYRWLPMNFTKDFAMNVSIVTMANGSQHVWGMVLKEGRYVTLKDATLTTEYNEKYYQEQFNIQVETDEGDKYSVDAKVLSLIPLRNRRQSPDGDLLNTRITEGMTEFKCNGLTGYGMSEYLDQIVDGEPVGKAC